MSKYEITLLDVNKFLNKTEIEEIESNLEVHKIELSLRETRFDSLESIPSIQQVAMYLNENLTSIIVGLGAVAMYDVVKSTTVAIIRKIRNNVKPEANPPKLTQNFVMGNRRIIFIIPHDFPMQHLDEYFDLLQNYFPMLEAGEPLHKTYIVEFDASTESIRIK